MKKENPSTETLSDARKCIEAIPLSLRDINVDHDCSTCDKTASCPIKDIVQFYVCKHPEEMAKFDAIVHQFYDKTFVKNMIIFAAIVGEGKDVPEFMGFGLMAIGYAMGKGLIPSPIEPLDKATSAEAQLSILLGSMKKMKEIRDASSGVQGESLTSIMSRMAEGHKQQDESGLPYIEF